MFQEIIDVTYAFMSLLVRWRMWTFTSTYNKHEEIYEKYHVSLNICAYHLSTTMWIRCKRDWNVFYHLSDEILASYIIYFKRKSFI